MEKKEGNMTSVTDIFHTEYCSTNGLPLCLSCKHFINAYVSCPFNKEKSSSCYPMMCKYFESKEVYKNDSKNN